jgi:NAD(P)-dependent dehydrogenase (short-subunit alcohol dehydrogenase family)
MGAIIVAMDELRFDGKVAVVTGAGGGIGAGEARLLAARGARVVVNDWGRGFSADLADDGGALDVVTEICDAGGEAVVDAHDVGTADGAGAIIERALGEWGRIDILVNNAGAARLAESPGAMTDDGIDLAVRTHLLGTIWACRRAWPEMAAQGGGRIVNTASATMLGVVNSWDYPAAKGGVFGFSRSLAVTGKPFGIRVNTIMPMAYTRPMHDYPNEEVRTWMASAFPASAVAPLVAYLAHDDVPCTGECFAVGAGRAARVAVVAAQGYQGADPAVTTEEFRDHWDEVMDLSDAALMRSGRDESALYRGAAQWSGDDTAYADA